MSNAFLLETTGNLPPQVPLTFTADSGGTATAAANNLNVFSVESSTNNDAGIHSIASGNTVTYQYTNRATGQVTTTDATQTTIITFPLAGSGTSYSVSGIVTVRVPATGDAASYDFIGAFKTDGANASKIGTEYPTTFEDVALMAADIKVLAMDNNVLLQVIGIAGTVINWDGFLTYRQVS